MTILVKQIRKQYFLQWLILVILAACSPVSAINPDPTITESSELLIESPTNSPDWQTYKNDRYHITLKYPGDWNVLETPTDEYPTPNDEVWFYYDQLPQPRTNSRAEIVLKFLDHDPSPDWAEQFFDDYHAEEFLLGDLPTRKISGVNKESQTRETALIAPIEDIYLLAMPNQGYLSLEYFDQIMATLHYLPPATQIPTPSITPDQTSASANQMITPENASQVVALTQLGTGTLMESPVVSADGEILAVPSSKGIDLYDVASLELWKTIPVPASQVPVIFSSAGDLLLVSGYDVLFDSDGKLSPEGYPKAVINLVRIADGQIVFTASLPQLCVNTVDISADGALIAVGCNDGFTWVWDAANGELIFTLQGYEAAFSPDGSSIVTNSWWTDPDQTVRLFSSGEGKLIKQWPGQRAVFAPNGLLAVESDGAVRVNDLQSGSVLLALSGSYPAFSADSQLMALRAGETIEVYQLSDNTLVQTLGDYFLEALDIQFAPDNTTLAATMQYCDIPTGGCAFPMEADYLWRISDAQQLSHWTDVAFLHTYLPDSDYLLRGWKYLQLVDTSTGAIEGTLGVYDSSLAGVGASSDSSLLVTTTEYNNVPNIWSVKDYLITNSMPSGGGDYGFKDPVFLPQGNTVLLDWNLWRPDGGNQYAELEKHIQESGLKQNHLTSAALSADKSLLALGFFGGLVHIWDLSSDQLAYELDGFNGEVNSLSFSNDGDLAAVYGYPDYKVQIWDLPEGKKLAQITGKEWTHDFTAMAFAPDGQGLATVAQNWDQPDRGVVEVWSAVDGKRQFQLEAVGMLTVAYSPDGQLIATGGVDRTVRLWKADDGQLLNVLNGHSGQIQDLVFAPDGSWLATASYDGTVIIWSLPMP